MAHEFDANVDLVQPEPNQTVYDGITQFTLSMMFFPVTGLAVNQAIVNRHNAGLSIGWSLRIDVFSINDLKCELADAGAADIHTTGGPITVKDKWYHVVLIYDGTQAVAADRADFYFDGVLQAVAMAGTIPTQLGPAVARNIQMGLQSGAFNACRMRLGEMYIWPNQILNSPGEIKNMARGCPPKRNLMNLDMGLLVAAPIDRSGNHTSTSVSGTTVVPHPPTVLPRSLCGSGLRYRPRPPLKRTAAGIGVGV